VLTSGYALHDQRTLWVNGALGAVGSTCPFHSEPRK